MTMRMFSKPAAWLAIWLWASVATANLIPNGDFNIPANKPNRPNFWSEWMNGTTPEPRIHQAYLTSGGINNSACIELGVSYEAFLPLVYGTDNYARYRLDSGNAISINANSYYKFSIYYRTENISTHQAVAEIEMFRDSTQLESIILALKPSSTWTQFTHYFRPIRASDRGFGQMDTNKLRFKFGAISTLGKVRFDNASLVEVTKAEYDANHPLKLFTPDPLTARRSTPPIFSSAPGYTVRRDAKGAWWMVRPNGQPFLVRSVQYPEVLATINPALYQAIPTSMKTSSTGRTNSTYHQSVYRRLGALAFNAEAIYDGSTSLTAHPFGQCHFHFVRNGDIPTEYLLKDRNGNIRPERKPMPDPYHPQFRNWLRQQIHATLGALQYGGIAHKSFAGYFTDNEMGVEFLDQYIWSPACAAEFREFIRARYNNNIQAVNTAWSSSYASFSMSSFNDITNSTNKAKIVIHHLNDPLYKDLDAFIRKLLKDYYRMVCELIREYEVQVFGDSNHDGLANVRRLIATNRYDLAKYPNGCSPEMLRVAEVLNELRAERPGFFFDIIAFNNYPGDERYEGIRSKDNSEFIERLSQISGLPALISEFGVHGRDCGFPTGSNTRKIKGWFYRSVENQTDRGLSYQKMMLQWASSPNIIGGQWFQWSDIMQDEWGTTALPVNTESLTYNGRNSGVINQANQFYTPLTDRMKQTNLMIDKAFGTSLPRADAPDWQLFQ